MRNQALSEGLGGGKLHLLSEVGSKDQVDIKKERDTGVTGLTGSDVVPVSQLPEGKVSDITDTGQSDLVAARLGTSKIKAVQAQGPDAEGFDRDVVIVGAGPNGLMAAILLASYGVDPARIEIVDGKSGVTELTKATTLQAGALKVFDQAGVLDEVLANSVLVRESNFYDRPGHEFADVKFDVLADETKHPYLVNIPQSDTERILEKRAKELGISIRWNTRLETLNNDEDRAQVKLAGPDGEHTLNSRYVIGCDGVHSTVRKQTGIGFDGDMFGKVMGAVDIDLPGCGLARDQSHAFFTKDGTLELVPLPGEGERFRAGLILSKEKAVDGKHLSHDEDQARLAHFLKLAGIEVTPEQQAAFPEISYFKVFERIADKFKDGRVFLAGDAAHQHSPETAQGLNTGVQDVQNLAFKMARVLNGGADPAFLETYEAERRPVAEHVLSMTGMDTRMFSWTGVLGKLRNIGMSVVIPHAQRIFARDVAELNLRYDRSPDMATEACGVLSAGSLAPLDAEFGMAGHPGTWNLEDLLNDKPVDDLAVVFASPDRDATLPKELGRTLDRLADRSHTQTVMVADRPEEAELLKVALTRRRIDNVHVAVDDKGELRDRFGAEKKGLFVVRPDGYVRYSHDHLDIKALRRHDEKYGG